MPPTPTRGAYLSKLFGDGVPSQMSLVAVVTAVTVVVYVPGGAFVILKVTWPNASVVPVPPPAFGPLVVADTVAPSTGAPVSSTRGHRDD